MNFARPFFFLALAAIFSPAFAADRERVISGWLATQTNVQSWAADFTQTRTFKTLAQPLVSTGRVWFAAPRNFRWELGEDQTIAIRGGNVMLVLYPRLRRAERYALDDAGKNPWKDALALLQTGFPRSRDELDWQFELLSIGETNELIRLELRPKSAAARKWMPRIGVLLGTNLALAGTELAFADGSSMRTEFRNARTNVPTPGKFDLTIPPDFKLVEPLKSGRD